MLKSKYHYNGIHGLRNIAAFVGINAGTLHSRVNKMGMTMEEAVAQGTKRMTPTVESRAAAKKRADRTPVAKRVYVPVKYPDLLSEHWKKALGMEAVS